MNDVVLNKKVSIERCLRQVGEYYRMDTGLPLERDHLRQDAIAMNLQRAAELCIDIANHLVRIHKLGLPRDSRESFTLLEQAGLLDAELARRLRAMVGFRNVLVHQYTQLDPDILVDVVEHRGVDLLVFAATAVQMSFDRP
jgi:uncharacterized protein YutE (UPF0331/DUF86 family)